MKNIKTALLAIALLLFSGCGSKVPFKSEEPLENAALVYIYVTSAISTVESSSSADYNIRINNKRVLQRVKSGEYTLYNLKPENLTLSAVRSQIEEKKLTLDLKAGEVYYLRVRDNLENGGFVFEKVSKEVGAKEIAKTGLAGSIMEEKSSIVTEIVEVINPEDTQKLQAPLSKPDELQKAYNLKEKGILSEEEYKALKKEILTK